MKYLVLTALFAVAFANLDAVEDVAEIAADVVEDVAEIAAANADEKVVVDQAQMPFFPPMMGGMGGMGMMNPMMMNPMMMGGMGGMGMMNPMMGGMGGMGGMYPGMFGGMNQNYDDQDNYDNYDDSPQNFNNDDDEPEYPIDYSLPCNNQCNCKQVCVRWKPCTCRCPPPCTPKTTRPPCSDGGNCNSGCRPCRPCMPCMVWWMCRPCGCNKGCSTEKPDDTTTTIYVPPTTTTIYVPPTTTTIYVPPTTTRPPCSDSGNCNSGCRPCMPCMPCMIWWMCKPCGCNKGCSTEKPDDTTTTIYVPPTTTTIYVPPTTTTTTTTTGRPCRPPPCQCPVCIPWFPCSPCRCNQRPVCPPEKPPTDPNYPIHPDYPTDPNYPIHPDYPTDPNYPIHPDYPVDPNYPIYPQQPKYPDTPEDQWNRDNRPWRRN